ncbi:Alanine--tRNA ligase [Bienertia sinuspersici]
MGLKELSRILSGVEVSKPKNVTLSKCDFEWLRELVVQKIDGTKKGMGLKELSNVVLGVEVLNPMNVT